MKSRKSEISERNLDTVSIDMDMDMDAVAVHVGLDDVFVYNIGNCGKRLW